MNLRALVVMVALLPCAALASDYEDGLSALAKGDFTAARTHLMRSAERGHASSQLKISQLALQSQPDRAANAEEALGWALAARENGAQADDAIQAARAVLGGISEEVALGIAARYGRASIERDWLPAPESCKQASASQSGQPNTNWYAAIVNVNEQRLSGQLLDIYPWFAFPEKPAQPIANDVFIARSLQNAKQQDVKKGECHGLSLVLAYQTAPGWKKKEAIEALLARSRAADQSALYDIAMIMTMNNQNSLPLIQQAAQAGEPRAQYYLAKWYARSAASRRWLELAAAGNVPHAQINLAEVLLTEPSKDVARIRSLLDQAGSSTDQYVTSRLAGILAGATDEALYDPAAAMAFAERLDNSKWPLPLRLESAALAYAAGGDFNRARKTQLFAIKQAESLQYATTAMRARLDLYSSGKSWRGYLAQEYLEAQ